MAGGMQAFFRPMNRKIEDQVTIQRVDKTRIHKRTFNILFI